MESEKPQTPPAPPAAYVNFLRVGTQATEFFLSFGQLAGQGDAAHLVAALVTSPAHAKAMSEALATAVGRYEEQFGAIAEARSAAQKGAPGAPGGRPGRASAPPRQRAGKPSKP